MKFVAASILVTMLLSNSIKAQESDSLVYAQGKVINSATKEAVNAKISYRSEPYGNIMGSLNGSSFQFPLFDGQKYSITIEAPGFASSKFLLDPVTAVDRKVIKDVELGLPGSVAKNSETTHTIGKILTLENLIFDVGTSTITKESYPELDELVNMLKNNPNMVIQLEGHTDIKGDPKLNMKLSQSRVDAVKSYLITKGANKNRVKAKAFGGTLPISRENTEAASKLNRRVELRILEN
ncbi:MAG: OmpA family protein [Chryseotalea sp. WA131a]|jgi:outer membrane protein OmpA-like peptidoglycan-associated protein|nr:MAG: OmpA family protein [Chryseotalea sp. WA131a]